MEFAETRPDVAVAEPEYARLLGYPAEAPLTGRAAELTWQTRAWYRREGRPWVYGRLARSLEIREDGVVIEDVRLTGRALREGLGASGAHAACLVAVGAGPELEAQARALWLADKPDEYFFLETYGAAVVEHLMAAVASRLDRWAAGQGCVVTAHLSPGYPGWDVSEQGRLLGVLRRTVDAPWPGVVDVIESGTLRPTKSQLAVFGVTSDARRAVRGATPCDACVEPCDVQRPEKPSPTHPHPTVTGRRP